MDTAQLRLKSLFSRIVRICRDLAEDTSSDRVHQFRTTFRRIESLLAADDFDLSPKDRKILEQLDDIRKRAGKVRDIDVQLSALSSVVLDRIQDQKKQVQAALERRRNNRAVKLSRAASDFSGKRKIKHLAEKLDAQAPRSSNQKRDYVAIAMKHLSQAAQEFGMNSNNELVPDALHGYRLALKKVRYTAEIGGKGPAAKALVAQAKRIQDAIGEWRDWDNLTKTAARELEEVHSPALISFLNNVTGAKLSIATRTAVEVTNHLLSTAPAKKMPESVKNRQSRRGASLQA